MMIQTGIAPGHTAADMVAFSNFAHLAEGVIIAAVAIIALVQAVQHPTGKSRLAWPMLVLFSGIFLLFFLLLPYHGLAKAPANWAFIFGDPQQRQHFFIGCILVVAGWAELANAHQSRPWRAAVFPLALGVIGVSFLVHMQHGTSSAVTTATAIHRMLSADLLTAAALAGASRAKRDMQWLEFAWPVALLGAALLLFLYREPVGAYLEHQ